MIPVDEALARILSAFHVLPGEQVAISDAHGRVLAEDTVARLTKPPTDVSAMDGYAVIGSDVEQAPAKLKVVGMAPAGDAYGAEIKAGEAVRIFTGGPLPKGADTIVIQELTDASGDAVTINEPIQRGRYVRRRGLDFSEGDKGPAAGTRLEPRHIALIASMNIPWLTVTRRPRVAILGTGDELVMPGEPAGDHQIVSSNTIALAAMIEQAGGEAINLGIARDNETSLKRMAAGAANADLLVVTGGMSVGERDLVRQVLGDEGLDVDFWKIAMRPGKPLTFGRLNGTPMLGFPGNPVSSIVCGMLFMRPAIDAMLGVSEPSVTYETARLGAPLAANDERQDYLRGRLSRDENGERLVTSYDIQDSSMLATIADSDCLIMRPPHAPAAAAGETVRYVLL
ncbi:MAG: gephyrin-like molybdotransferase Glp [Pseudomonadota bacterium]